MAFQNHYRQERYMEIPMPSRGYKFVTCPTDLCKTQKKKPQPFLVGVSEIKAWQCPTFTWGNPTLSSALSSFTSEFGKGSGGSHSLLPPDKLVEARPGTNSPWGESRSWLPIRICFDVIVSHVDHHHTQTKLFGCYMIKPHGQLVLVSFIHY